MEKNAPLKICNTTIFPEEKITLALPTPELYSCIPMHIPIHIIHGKFKGPTLLISAAIYGDEINGIAIIQKLLKLNLSKSLNGTIIAIPAVNVYGLLFHTRNLPDQRDLKNSFPGSESGTFASRLAYLLNKEIFSLGTHYIDIFSGDLYQNTLPQILANTDSESCLEMAKAFHSRVIIHSNKTAIMHKDEAKPSLIYKCDEAWKVDPNNVKIGVNGIIRIMHHLKMIKPKYKEKKAFISKILKKTLWIRSPGSGMSEILKKIGSLVNANEHIANITDPFGTEKKHKIISPINGIIISINNFPLLNEGDFLIEIAYNLEKDVHLQDINIEQSESLEV